MTAEIRTLVESWAAAGHRGDLAGVLADHAGVTAGEDVAQAFALLRCGMPDEVAGTRLRISFGPRREGGRWVVAHEHHSFPDSSGP